PLGDTLTTGWTSWCDPRLFPTRSAHLEGHVHYEEQSPRQDLGYATEIDLDYDPTPAAAPRDALDVRWTARLGGPGYEFVESTALMASGDALVVGRTEGGGGLPAADGTLVWAQSLEVGARVVTGGDAIFLAGAFVGSPTIGGVTLESAGKED